MPTVKNKLSVILLKPETIYYGLGLTLVCANFVKQIKYSSQQNCQSRFQYIVKFKSQNLIEYFCKINTCAKSKSRKLRNHRHYCNYRLFEIAREKFWTIDRGTQSLHAQERLERGLKIYMLKRVGEGHPKFTCSRGLEGGTQIKRNCVDQQNRIKFKNIYFRLRLGAP